MARKTALVVCPGRGTYNKDDLGYLARHHADKAGLIGAIDAARLELGKRPSARWTAPRAIRWQNTPAATTPRR